MAFVGGKPEVVRVGCVGSVEEPYGGPFALYDIDHRNEVAVASDDRDVCGDLPPGHKCCVESEKQVDLLLSENRPAVVSESIEPGMAFSHLKPREVR